MPHCYPYFYPIALGTYLAKKINVHRMCLWLIIQLMKNNDGWVGKICCIWIKTRSRAFRFLLVSNKLWKCNFTFQKFSFHFFPKILLDFCIFLPVLYKRNLTTTYFFPLDQVQLQFHIKINKDVYFRKSKKFCHLEYTVYTFKLYWMI